ncbi:MAG: 23S rRNA (uracil(1939)-C(5))-methyltransferase RlmD [bacterium]
MKSKLRAGAQCTVTFEGYDRDGLAVGPGPGGVTVCAAGGVRGERARVLIEHVSPHRALAWGRIEALELESRDRRRGLRVDHRCGGCSWAHLGGGAQREAKLGALREALAAQGVAGAGALSITPSPKPAGYRNRGKYVVGRKRGWVVLGGYQPRSHNVVSTLGCPVMAPAVDRAARALASCLDAKGDWPVYDEKQRTGLLRYAGVRANDREEVLVTLVVTETGDRPWAELAEALASRVEGLVGLTLDVNQTGGNVLFGGQGEVVWGRPELSDRYGPVTVRLSGHGFGQVNREVAAALYGDAARAALAPLSGAGAVRRIWDLFSGAGALTQTLAVCGGEAVEVLGVERDEEAVRAAAECAVEAGLGGCRFRAGDANQLLEALMEEPPDVVVLNPPRTGCRVELLAALVASQVRRVVYVSCSAETLARDLAVLKAAGFELTHLQGYDMLPMTPHLEVLAVLER